MEVITISDVNRVSKKNIFVIFFIGYMVAIITFVCHAFYFTPSKWEKYSKRRVYYTFTMESYLKGLERDEIVELLGEPDASGDSWISYYIGNYVFLGLPEYSQSYIIYFNDSKFYDTYLIGPDGG